MTAANPTAADSAPTLTLTRTFNAEPEAVFDAWIDPQQASKWMGPRSMVSAAEVELSEPHVGGRYRVVMHRNDGVKLTVGGVYREISRPNRLVFTWTWEHEGHETLVTVTCRRVGRGTEMTLLHENFANDGSRDGHNKGWTQSLDQMGNLLAQTATTNRA
jgi:uncharacterized protein YndB with AHSA1/START domain